MDLATNLETLKLRLVILVPDMMRLDELGDWPLEGLDKLQLGLAVVVNKRSTADVVVEMRLFKK